jgi:hypothetical protein
MRRPAPELRERVSEGVWIRLGRAMAESLKPLVTIVAAGREAGVFAAEDPDLVANRIYVQVLGTMHLARVGAGVREIAPGVPGMFSIDPEAVRRGCVEDAVRLAVG